MEFQVNPGWAALEPLAEEGWRAVPGMTLRDYFAARVDASGVAMNVLEVFAGPCPSYAEAKVRQDWYARAEAAFRFHRADAMLKARGE